MKTHKIIFILTILIAGLCSAQTDTSNIFKETPFKLTDTNVVSGQYYRIFDLNFSGIDTLKKVSADKSLDSLITFINNLRVGNIMVMYSHYAEKGDSDHNCIKQSWDKAVAIKKYLRDNGLNKSNIVAKPKCYKPNFKKKVKYPSTTNNYSEFATIIILNL